MGRAGTVTSDNSLTVGAPTPCPVSVSGGPLFTRAQASETAGPTHDASQYAAAPHPYRGGFSEGLAPDQVDDEVDLFALEHLELDRFVGLEAVDLGEDEAVLAWLGDAEPAHAISRSR